MAARIRVYGQVQGVFYRVKTKEKADSLKGLSGFVKNEPDGSVLIEVQGDNKNVKKLIDWCYEGSRSAKVEKVKVEKTQLTNHEAFEIK